MLLWKFHEIYKLPGVDGIALSENTLDALKKKHCQRSPHSQKGDEEKDQAGGSGGGFLWVFCSVTAECSNLASSHHPVAAASFRDWRCSNTNGKFKKI